MELEERAEEILETLWIRTVEKKEDSVPIYELEKAKRPMEQLIKADYITISNNQAQLTEKGQPEAMNVVRRHRLAERILADILGTADTIIHEKACKFEHILDRGLEESICTLLGHPKVCPHGKPIPRGKCCQREQTQLQHMVAPLSQLTPGQKGRVSYVYAPESAKLQKLMAMGILPGAPISLIQRFPSYVFQIRQTQFAVDKEIADAIYIRLGEGEVENEVGDKSQPRRGWRKGRLARRLGLSKP